MSESLSSVFEDHKDREKARHRAVLRSCNPRVSDLGKPISQIEAEELIKIRCERIERQTEIAAKEAYSNAAARGVSNAGIPTISKPTASTSAPAVVNSDGPAPLPVSTGDIAHCFDGLHWNERTWKANLGKKPKWLISCVAIPGVQGVSETRWNPVLIGSALIQKGVAARSIRAKFQTHSILLADWVEAWKDHESEYLATE